MPIKVKYTGGRHVGTRRGCAGKVFGDTEEEARSRAATLTGEHAPKVDDERKRKKARRLRYKRAGQNEL